MKLLGVQTGQPERTPAKSGLTGHFKTPVTGAVQIGQDGLAGDTICDLDHHGGIDQAVYLFGEPDRQWWQGELGRDIAPGFFGENLLISDIQSASLAIGDLITVGDVQLQVTSPRIPCATYAAHIGDPQAIRQFYKADRPGAYARVLRNGQVCAGDPVSLAPYQGDRITLSESMSQYLRNFQDYDFLRRTLAVPAHFKLHNIARTRLGLM